MVFNDTFFSRSDYYAIGIEADSGRFYLAIPVRNGWVDYEEYYAISPTQYQLFCAQTEAALAFANACRQRQYDELLWLAPGSQRGQPIS